MMPQLKTEISTEGLANALREAAKAEDRKRKDLEIIVWCHLLRWYIDDPDMSLPTDGKHPDTLIFRVMNTHRSRMLCRVGMEGFRSDETPTPWMRAFYQRFVDWCNSNHYPAQGETRYSDMKALDLDPERNLFDYGKNI